MSLKAFLYDYRMPNTSIELTEIFLIGKDSICNLQLNQAEVEERHARIEHKGFGYLLRDLRSKSGTFINNQPITEAFLKEGDIIRIGNYQLLFSIERKSDAQGIGLKSKNFQWNIELSTLGNVAKSEFPILLLGPSGSGKEVLASALHKHSNRSERPSITVNCSALTETLVESELFGHVKGSFTGAIQDRKGAFEAANGGTLFLDEIGDLPFTLQAKLLRAIENQEIRPVGSDRTVKVNVRIIAATHQNLKNKIAEGSFRSDLFYRLNVITITPPALKDRMEDFDDLIYQFCREQKVRLSLPVLEELRRHSWPGNVRELKNFVSRASAYYPGTYIEPAHLEKLIQIAPILAAEEVLQEPSVSKLPTMKEIERQLIIKRLMVNFGNQRKTAHDLGIPKSTLHDRIRNYGIDMKQFHQVGTMA